MTGTYRCETCGARGLTNGTADVKAHLHGGDFSFVLEGGNRAPIVQTVPERPIPELDALKAGRKVRLGGGA